MNIIHFIFISYSKDDGRGWRRLIRATQRSLRRRPRRGRRRTRSTQQPSASALRYAQAQSSAPSYSSSGRPVLVAGPCPLLSPPRRWACGELVPPAVVVEVDAVRPPGSPWRRARGSSSPSPVLPLVAVVPGAPGRRHIGPLRDRPPKMLIVV